MFRLWRRLSLSFRNIAATGVLNFIVGRRVDSRFCVEARTHRVGKRVQVILSFRCVWVEDRNLIRLTCIVQASLRLRRTQTYNRALQPLTRYTIPHFIALITSSRHLRLTTIRQDMQRAKRAIVACIRVQRMERHINARVIQRQNRFIRARISGLRGVNILRVPILTTRKVFQGLHRRIITRVSKLGKQANHGGFYKGLQCLIVQRQRDKDVSAFMHANVKIG